MLTGLVERGKVSNILMKDKHLVIFSTQRKCTQYWPEPEDGTVEYGNIEVRLVAQKQYSYYIHRTMEISQVQTCDPLSYTGNS